MEIYPFIAPMEYYVDLNHVYIYNKAAKFIINRQTLTIYKDSVFPHKVEETGEFEDVVYATLNDIAYIKYGTCKKLQNHSLNTKFMKLKEDFEERQNIKRKKDLEQKKETIKKIQKTNKI